MESPQSRASARFAAQECTRLAVDYSRNSIFNGGGRFSFMLTVSSELELISVDMQFEGG